MENYNVKKIVESLFEEIPDIENVNLYLNNSELQRECNKVISDRLNEEFSNRIYDIDGCINFLNNVVSKQIKDKPYLIELNIIINTINAYIEKNEDLMSLTDEDKKPDLCKENKQLINMFMIISDEFMMKYAPDTEAEIKMAKDYDYKMNNDVPLTKEEVEDLMSFYLVSGFSIYNNDTSNKALNYALKNILENDYVIDEFLYKKLFVYTCKEEAFKKDISDVDLLFIHDKDFKDEMNFSWNDRVIRINNKIFTKNTPIRNFMTFFHEINHYKQHSEMEENLSSFLAAKDLYLANVLGDEYYLSNYNDLFLEKEANYKSYEDVYNFVKEKAPRALPKVEEAIYTSLVLHMCLENKNALRRVYNSKEEDINILFDKTLRKNNDFMYTILGQGIKNSLLIEYDITGKKRSIFELLEGKEFVTEHNIPSRCEIYNYLLYEEPVTYEYITSNLKLLEDKENEEKYGKYYEEARKILKQKENDYKLRVFINKRDHAFREGKEDTYKYYDSFVKGYNKQKANENIEKNKKKGYEIKTSHKWLYDLVDEIEAEQVRKIENGKIR